MCIIYHKESLPSAKSKPREYIVLGIKSINYGYTGDKFLSHLQIKTLLQDFSHCTRQHDYNIHLSYVTLTFPSFCRSRLSIIINSYMIIYKNSTTNVALNDLS